GRAPVRAHLAPHRTPQEQPQGPPQPARPPEDGRPAPRPPGLPQAQEPRALQEADRYARPAPLMRGGWPAIRCFAGGGSPAVAWLASAALASACHRTEPSPATPGVTGTLTIDGAPAQLVRCRPGHAAHVFVEVDSTRGTLRFGEGKLAWNGSEVTCEKLDRSWGGGVRRDGSAYFRGTLSFRCSKLIGDLALDCGQITPEEGAELASNRAAAASASQPTPGGSASQQPAPAGSA